MKLWNWYENQNGFAITANWLAARDVSNFNPSAAPPMTEAKAIMIDQGRSTAESFLVEQIISRKGEFASGVIGSPFFALCDRLAGIAPTGVKVPQAALLHALKEAGWQDIGRIKSREFETKKQLFVAPDMVGKSKTELRRMVEELPSAIMKIK